MSAQPIVFDIPEESPKPKRMAVHGQSWLHDLQLAGQFAEIPWSAELASAPAQEYLEFQFFSQPRSARSYVESGAQSAPVIRNIDALLASGEDGVVPTDDAYKRARSLIEATYAEVNRIKKHRGVPEIFPKPSVTTDDIGGIRLAWRNETKQV